MSNSLLRQGFAAQAGLQNKDISAKMVAPKGAVALRSLSGAGTEYFMHYVYILKSQKDNSLYVGSTEDIKRRLTEHNKGQSQYSKTKAPFTLKWYCAFPAKQQALLFEKYLKHGSGHAFARKHLL